MADNSEITSRRDPAGQAIDDRSKQVHLPKAGLLSNGTYQILMMQDGTGFSAFDGYVLTPWRDDDRSPGTHLYIQDVDAGTLWSAGFEPVRARPDQYAAWMGPGSFHIRRRDHEIETELEICAVPHRNAEIRRYTFTNRSDRRRCLRLTSFAEVALNTREADAGHPAFSKLFVQTEYAEEIGGLIARRRPRAQNERPPVVAHAFVSPESHPQAYETDRAAFIGRGRTPADPRALDPAGTGLSNTVGNVLDPILSLQTEIAIAPGDRSRFVMVVSGGYDRGEVIETVVALRSESARIDAFLDATLREQRIRDELKIGPRNADRYHRLLAGVLRGMPELGPSPDLARKSGGSAAVEQKLGLDPSLHLLVGRISDSSELPVARLLMRARDFWKALGVRTQVLLLNDRPGERADALERELYGLVDESMGGRRHTVIRHADTLPADDQLAVQSVARLWITEDRAGLLRVAHDDPPDDLVPIDLPATLAPIRAGADDEITFRDDLRCFNGFGGFSPDGKEYVIQLRRDGDELKLPPRTWVNVICSEHAGTIVSESGAAFTWTGNSREHRLTPWYNDSLVDPHGEALYLRDEETGEIWSPTAGPIRDGIPVEVRHGFGYSTFRKRCRGLNMETTHFVPRDAPYKVVRLRVANESERPRRPAAAAYAQWVLGSSLGDRRFVVTDYDDVSGCVLARNPHNEFIRKPVAFAALIVQDVDRASFTTSRTSFLGPMGDTAHPQALLDDGDLDRRAGAGLDPCAAFLKHLDLDPGQHTDILFLLGQVEDVGSLVDLIDGYSDASRVQMQLDEVTEFWDRLTSGIHVETPSEAIDFMLNGWLLYQNISSRIWARSGSNQSGGAFGFRDQIQDASALASVWPERTREQILLHASHQFEEGDVMHWWHPPTSRGIRTRFSDDLLWLPFITLDYVRTTGDSEIWEEEVGYLTGPELPDGVDEIMIDPQRSELRESLYRHCCRALDRSMPRGAHGLPLMGSGDWNDGMNRVGREGRGESVWLGFFLYDILTRFARVCKEHGDAERAEKYLKSAAALKQAVNDAGWDGAWYRRAYYDDGVPIGSISSEECKIDALAQSWAVLSGAADGERAEMALDAVEQHLIDIEGGFIRLLTPPFEHTDHDPGYIRGYLRGVRENGGQYTHAALWVVAAMAKAGRCDSAAHLLEMITPVAHTRTEADAMRYEAEPYVVAADIYSEPPHVGKGGWTWYTGSAGWMCRVGMESILGIRLVGGDHLEIAPCIPPDWPEFRVDFRHPVHGTMYHIHVRNARKEGRITGALLDGEPIPVETPLRISLSADGGKHELELVM